MVRVDAHKNIFDLLPACEVEIGAVEATEREKGFMPGFIGSRLGPLEALLEPASFKS